MVRRQPKPAFELVALSEEDKAAIARVTRHNPPWIRGEYLGFTGNPCPGSCSSKGPARPEPANDDAATASPAAAGGPLELRARVARLLDWGRPRLPEELDLAEAVCALKWPKWPGYAGAVDLDLLRLALQNVVIDTETLNWLGGHELARACKVAVGDHSRRVAGRRHDVWPRGRDDVRLGRADVGHPRLGRQDSGPGGSGWMSGPAGGGTSPGRGGGISGPGGGPGLGWMARWKVGHGVLPARRTTGRARRGSSSGVAARVLLGRRDRLEGHTPVAPPSPAAVARGCPALVPTGAPGAARDTNGMVVIGTDFGPRDGAVSAMKGVALGVDRGLTLHDLTQEIPPFDI